MKKMILERMHKIVAVFMLLFGVLALYLSMRDLKFGSFSSPKSGMAPTVFSIGLVVFATINLVLEFCRKNQVPEKLKDVNWLKFVEFMGTCILYVFLVKKIGFVVDTLVCLLLLLKVAGLKGWVKPVVISVIFSIACWALFTYAMSVPLPGASWF